MNYIDDASVHLLLTETRLIVRRGQNLFNTFGLDMVEDLYIDKHVINGWFQIVKEMVAPLSYGIFLLLSFIFTVMTLLLFSIYFYEVIQIKLKTQEVARFAAWEFTGYPLHDYDRGRADGFSDAKSAILGDVEVAVQDVIEQ